MSLDSRSILAHMTELVGTPSVSSVSPDWDMPNAPVIAALASRLETAGWRVEIQHLEGRPGKQNLIASLGSGPGGLILAGHTDTVPYNEELWSSDPFKLTERDGRVYGLGSADMKSFLAMAMAASADIDPAKLREPIYLLATADEESSMSGARALVAAGRPRARYAVIGEPTGLKPVRMHKGIFMESLRVTGQSGHSSDPSLGHNALEGMAKIIEELIAWRTELRTSFTNDAFRIPYSTLNLGHIHGGDNPNRICGDCELQIDLRFIPGLNRADLRAELHTRALTALQNFNPALKLDFRPLFEGCEPMATAVDAQIVKAAEQLTGAQAESVAYATEAPFLDQLGIEVLVMGPGSIDQAHQPDEYLELNQIEPTVEYLRALIRKFCV